MTTPRRGEELTPEQKLVNAMMNPDNELIVNIEKLLEKGDARDEAIAFFRNRNVAAENFTFRDEEPMFASFEHDGFCGRTRMIAVKRRGQTTIAFEDPKEPVNVWDHVEVCGWSSECADVGPYHDMTFWDDDGNRDVLICDECARSLGARLDEIRSTREAQQT